MSAPGPSAQTSSTRTATSTSLSRRSVPRARLPNSQARRTVGSVSRPRARLSRNWRAVACGGLASAECIPTPMYQRHWWAGSLRAGRIPANNAWRTGRGWITMHCRTRCAARMAPTHVRLWRLQRCHSQPVADSVSPQSWRSASPPRPRSPARRTRTRSRSRRTSHRSCSAPARSATARAPSLRCRCSPTRRRGRGARSIKDRVGSRCAIASRGYIDRNTRGSGLQVPHDYSLSRRRTIATQSRPPAGSRPLGDSQRTPGIPRALPAGRASSGTSPVEVSGEHRQLVVEDSRAVRRSRPTAPNLVHGPHR